MTILAITRRADREKLLRSSSVDHVVIDNGSIVEKVKTIYNDGVDKVLGLVSSTLPGLREEQQFRSRICASRRRGVWILWW